MSKQHENMPNETYEAPQCLEKGSIASLTQQNKGFGSSDGFFLQGQGLMNVS